MSDIYHLRINLNDQFRCEHDAYIAYKNIITKLMAIEKVIRFCRGSDEFSNLHVSQKKLISRCYIALTHLIMILSDKDDTVSVLKDPKVIGDQSYFETVVCFNVIIEFYDNLPKSFEFYNISKSEIHDLHKSISSLIRVIYHHVPFYMT